MLRNNLKLVQNKIRNFLLKSKSQILHINKISLLNKSFSTLSTETKSNREKSDLFDKKTQNRPTNLFKLFSMPRYVQALYYNMTYPLSLPVYVKLWKNLSSEINTNICTGRAGNTNLLNSLLIFAYLKNSIFIVVENDLDADKMIKLVERNLVEPAIYIDKSIGSEVMKFYSKRSVFILNYEKLIKCDSDWTQYIEYGIKPFVILYNIQRFEILDKWLNNNLVKSRLFTNSLCFSIQKTINNFNFNIIQKHFTKVFNSITLAETEQDDILHLNVLHYGMSCTNDQMVTVSVECARKYTRLNKRVMIICSSVSDQREIIKELSTLTKKELVNVITNTEVNSNSSNTEIIVDNNFEKERKVYDVLIEASFVSEEEFYSRKKKFLNVKELEECIMISLLKGSKDLKIIDELRQEDIIKIKIRNLLSSTFLFNDEFTLVEGEGETNNAKILPEVNEFYSKVEKFLNIAQKNSRNIEFESYYDNIKNNPQMLKLICRTFFEQNYNEFFEKEKEDLSLLTGEKGMITVLIKPISTKQLEERYFILKFLLRQGLCETANYEDKVLRIFNSFNFVFDIPIQRYEQIKKLGAEEKIEIEPITELPVVFHHQFSDMLKGNKNKKKDFK